MSPWQRRTRGVLAIVAVAAAAALAVAIKRAADRAASSPDSTKAVASTAGEKAPPAAAEPTALTTAPPTALTLVRVAMLPLSDRTTIVAEFSGPVHEAEEVDAREGTVAIEVGPVRSGVQPQDLAPAARVPHVSGVSVREQARPGGDMYVSLTIARRGSSDHHLRVSGSRVYVDFTPAAKAEPTAPEPSAPEPSAPVLARSAPATEPVGARPDVPSSAAAPPAPVSATGDPETVYRELESTTVSRGRTLAARPDVKGLLRLRADLEQRDRQLGQQRPADMDRILGQLLRLTDQARGAQLERDRRLFLNEKPSKER